MSNTETTQIILDTVIGIKEDIGELKSGMATVITQAADQESRIRSLEKSGWKTSGAWAVVVAIVGWLGFSPEG